MYCGFGRLPSTDTSGMVGNLKRGVWSSAASAGVTAITNHRRKKKLEFLRVDVAFYLFFKWLYFTVDLFDFDSSLLCADILLQK